MHQATSNTVILMLTTVRVKDGELEALLVNNLCPTQKEIVSALRATCKANPKLLHALGVVQNQRNWV